MKLAKNQASAKQQPEAEVLLFENGSHSSFTLSSKNNNTNPNKKQKKKHVCKDEVENDIYQPIWKQ